MIRGIGPSLTASNVPNPLGDPTLTLFDDARNTLNTNDDWKQSPQHAEITASGISSPAMAPRRS